MVLLLLLLGEEGGEREVSLLGGDVRVFYLPFCSWVRGGIFGCVGGKRNHVWKVYVCGAKFRGCLVINLFPNVDSCFHA